MLFLFYFFIELSSLSLGLQGKTTVPTWREQLFLALSWWKMYYFY